MGTPWVCATKVFVSFIGILISMQAIPTSKACITEASSQKLRQGAESEGWQPRATARSQKLRERCAKSFRTMHSLRSCGNKHFRLPCQHRSASLISTKPDNQ
ncbi:MAG: hypothetical protein EBZ04_02660 [Betaproteobacteria bacterium]|nr:hypothetical protein [Betaproteobacteria bacterium]